jgi:hypothetical protein
MFIALHAKNKFPDEEAHVKNTGNDSIPHKSTMLFQKLSYYLNMSVSRSAQKA